MKTLNELKSDIESLPRHDYVQLVHWLSERDWKAWDEEIEQDVATGKLDFLIAEALEEKSRGLLKEL
ncbi:hypothetical protein [uncultured Thiodictyon sp.]|uniref:hypothetical protein n=1 Tax=uncultured Thiodictyon sp. TaxID=1846217 RepID=UPI0025D97567|nr:hypothetical protein [uncultured Thiodictyon sp.]